MPPPRGRGRGRGRGGGRGRVVARVGGGRPVVVVRGRGRGRGRGRRVGWFRPRARRRRVLRNGVYVYDDGIPCCCWCLLCCGLFACCYPQPVSTEIEEQQQPQSGQPTTVIVEQTQSNVTQPQTVDDNSTEATPLIQSQPQQPATNDGSYY